MAKTDEENECVKPPWYEQLYSDFRNYDDEPYTATTVAEVSFIQRVISTQPAQRILDVGCGTGRHSVELAKRGHAVTGVDLSSGMLGQARAKAAAAGVNVSFEQRDARCLGYEATFDAAIMLCEGGFSLVETDAMDRRIIQGIAQALRPGGTLVMTAPNAATMMSGRSEGSAFDLVTLRETFTLDAANGPLICSQRYYTCPELKVLLETSGFEKIRFFSVTADGYDLEKAPQPADFEFGAVATRETR